MKGKNGLKIVIGVFFAALCLYVFLIWEGILFIKHPLRERYPVVGIDVSHYQGEIEWQDIKEDLDITFVFMKATEGSIHVDEKF